MGAEPTKPRFASMDVLKGFIILVVVFGHILISSTGSADAREMPLWMQIMYLGLMSFFIISGYFYRPGRGFVENMKRRGQQLFVSLVICAIVLPIITYCWLALCGQPSDASDILDAIVKTVFLSNLFEPLGPVDSYIACATCVGYYYLWAMLGGFIIFYGLADRVMDDWRKLAVVLVVLLVVFCLYTEYWGVYLPFEFEFAPLAAIFMFIGAILAKFRAVEKVEAFEWRSIKYWAPMLVCGVAGVAMCILLPPGSEFDWAVYGEYGGLSVPPYIVETLLMFVVFTYVAKLVSMLPLLTRFLNICGRHTLGMILYHGFIATLLFAPFYTIPTTSWFPSDAPITVKAVVALVTIILILIICNYGPKLLGKVCGKRCGIFGNDEGPSV